MGCLTTRTHTTWLEARDYFGLGSKDSKRVEAFNRSVHLDPLLTFGVRGDLYFFGIWNEGIFRGRDFHSADTPRKSGPQPSFFIVFQLFLCINRGQSWHRRSQRRSPRSPPPAQHNNTLLSQLQAPP